MDKECIPLCDALNSIPGITTVCSCCGHDKKSFSIWFKLNKNKTKYLNIIGRVFDFRYGCPEYWLCILDNGDVPENLPVFWITSGTIRGIKAYSDSKKIAENIYAHLNNRTFCKNFLK